MHSHCHVNAAILPQALDLKAYKWVYFCLRRFEPSCDLTLTDGRGFRAWELNRSPITGCKVIAVQGQVSGFTANPSSSSGTGKLGEKIVSPVELAISDHARWFLFLLSYCYDFFYLGDSFVPSRHSHHQYKKPTLHPVGFFSPTPACLRGFVRILVDSGVPLNSHNSLIFSLFAPLFSLPLAVMQIRSPQVLFFKMI